MAQDIHHSPSPRRSEDLIAEIARNREALAAHRVGLRRASNVGDRLKRSLHGGNAGLFFGSAVVLGVLLSLIPSVGRARRERKLLDKVGDAAQSAAKKRQKTESKSLAAIVIGMAGKAAFEAAKPVVMKMLREHYLNPNRGQAQAQARSGEAAGQRTRPAADEAGRTGDFRGV